MNSQASRLMELNKLAEVGKRNSVSKIISVCSGKGGTGKTFFAANFAYQLSRLNKKVLLVDLDLNFSNLNILLNQTTTKTISSFFAQTESIDEIVFNYAVNLDLIYGDSGRSDYPRVSREILDYFFVMLRKIQDKYDYIILDSSAGAYDLVLRQLLKSDYNIIVTSPEPTALMDAYVILKLLIENESETERFVVVNKCSDADEGENAFINLSTAVNHFLKEHLELLGIISYDSAAHKSIINQELLLNFDPQSIAANEINLFVKRFITITQLANNNQPR
ncbi:MAG: AAA family ATPase [Ignavibacteriales bacterium]|nr:AAA family ATPase [Ignavibacteriales bacterium]